MCIRDSPDWYDARFHRYARLLFGLSARHCSRLITASNYTAGRIAARWPDVGPIEVVPWPAVVRTRTVRALPPRPWQVVMVSATEAHKNHVGAIEAIETVRGSLGDDVGLTLIGPAGRSERDVMAHARRADPDGLWIRRLIDIPDSELEQTYRSAWVVIQPSFDEGFCLPLLEAAAYGTPAVHSGRGSMPEVVSGVNANSVDPLVLSEHVVALADPQRYAAASQSALADCGRMSPARFADELTRLIADVRAATRSRRHRGVERLPGALRDVRL